MQRITKTQKNRAKAPYTILIVGETGVGKPSLLKLIKNVLDGNDTGRYNLDNPNEQGCSHNQNQTSSARLYELTTNNGIAVCVGACQRGDYM